MPATSAAALKRKRERARECVREWKKRNPEKVKAQKRCYRERKAWPRILGTRPGKPCRYDPDKIVLLNARVELTDFRKTATQSTNNPPDIDDFDPDEILKGLFQSKSPKRKPAKRKPTKKQYESSESETDEELLREMEEVLSEPEDPVKRRIRQIKKNRKKRRRKPS